MRTLPFDRASTPGTRRVWVVAVAALLLALLLPAARPADAAVKGRADTLVAGAAHTCVLSPDGIVRCWGSNTYGQLGDGTKVSSTTPVAVLAVAGGAPLQNVTSLAAGADHTCARMTDATVRCWGRNSSGQLGDGTKTSRSIPVRAKKLAAVATLAGGSAHTCARLTSGAVKCWGSNSDGQLGDGTRTSRSTAVTARNVSAAKAIAAGAAHTCAITGSSGVAKCWGRNSVGQLGDKTTTRRLKAVPVAGVSKAKSIAAGRSHTCAVVGTTGVVKCWGSNTSGQLGTGSTAKLSKSAVQARSVTGATAVTAGSAFTCARLIDGTARCWGANASGQLGDGTATTRRTRVAVKSLAGVSTIAAGPASVCAMSATATQGVACWGAGGSGRLGDGATTNSRVPVATVGLMPATLTIGASRNTLPPDGSTTATVGAFVADAGGLPVCGVAITFAVATGDVTLQSGAGVTDCAGAAGTTVQASSSAGANTITAATAAYPFSADTAIEESTAGTVSVQTSTGTTVAITVTPPAGQATAIAVAAVSSAVASDAPLGSVLDVEVTIDDAAASPILLVDGLLATPVAAPAFAAAAVSLTTHYSVTVQGDTSLSAGLYQVADGVKLLDSATLAALTSTSDDGTVLRFSSLTPQLASLKTGDLVASEISADLPSALRGTVVSRSVPDATGAVRLTVTPAEMRDIMGRLSIKYDSPYRRAGGVVLRPLSAGPSGVTTQGTYDQPLLPMDEITLELGKDIFQKVLRDWKSKGASASATLSGSVTVTVQAPHLVGCFDWDWGTLRCAEMSIAGGLSAAGSVQAALNFAGDFPLTGKMIAAVIPLAPFVAITPTWSTAIHYEGSLSGSAGISYGARYRLGVRYTDQDGLNIVKVWTRPRATRPT